MSLRRARAPADEFADELVVHAGPSVKAKGVDGAVCDRRLWGCGGN